MKIGVGISGGVDSALTARLLMEQGHEVCGYTMRLTDATPLEPAREVAGRLGIPWREVDLRSEFERCILSYFADEYACGRTPSPCCRCNPLIKFGALWEKMASDGCERMATGHYARLVPKGDSLELRQALDSTKDQSYFLALLKREMLPRILFPLGEMRKINVKEKAASLGLLPKDKKESQDLCFISKGSHADFVGRRHPELFKEGWIVDAGGKRLGRHSGAFQYTVGQRRGLGMGGGPWYVIRVDIPQNLVVVGHAEDMRTDSIVIENVNWLGTNGEGLSVRTRYLMRPMPARLEECGGGHWRVVFDEPAPLVPPGQLAVAYRGDAVVAGGWIVGDE